MKRTKSKRSGFTLVELLVAMLCATLAISMIISTVFFITASTRDLIDVSAQAHSVKSVKKYILQQGHKTDPTSEYTVNDAENTLSHLDTVIAQDTEILDIQFSEHENFIYCTLVFPNESYRFVAGSKKGG